MAAIENLGGWIRLCGMKEDELPFRRNEFCKLYKGFLINPPREFPNKLIGVNEGHNQIEFKDSIAPPVLVGNREKAMLVLEHRGEQLAQITRSSRGGMKRIGDILKPDATPLGQVTEGDKER